MDGIVHYCSRTTFDVARVFGAVWVFLCHASFFVHNYFGVFDVAIFFFISGFGMEISSSSSRALVRLVRFIAVFFFFSLLYFVFYSRLFFPTAWYLLAYSSIMVLYRFFSRLTVVYTVSFLLFVFLLRLMDFEYCYWTSTFAFLLGFYCARYRFMFSWSFSLISFSLFFLIFVYHDFIFYVFALPLFVRIFFAFCSLLSFSFLSRFAFLVFPFFSLHCFFLGLFDATWVYDYDVSRSFSFLPSLSAFLLAVLGAWFLWRYVPVFSKKKFWIFQ